MKNIFLYNKKMKEFLHYIIERSKYKNNVGRTVLYKLLYFSDFNYYKIHNKSITNETYLKFFRGPVASHFNNLKSELIYEKKISEDIKLMFSGFKYYKYEYLSLKTLRIKH